MSATVESISDHRPLGASAGVVGRDLDDTPENPLDELLPELRARQIGGEPHGGAGEPPRAEHATAALLGHIARLEASMGAALALLRRCIVERSTPTREALAAEAGFALGMSREAALAELDELAQLVGVSSLR